MIWREIMLKKLIAVVLVLVTLLSLFACANDDTSEEIANSDAPQTTVSDNKEAEKITKLLVSMIGEYSIIFPERGVSRDVTAAANELKDILEEMGGSEVGFHDDFIYKGEREIGQYEILIGNTNREESALVYSDLKKYNDYEVRLCGEQLVVAGMNDARLAVALRELVEAIKALPADTEYFFDSETMQRAVEGIYAVDKMTLGEHDISEYVIAYKNSKTGERMAQMIGDAILSTVGYKLDTVIDKDVDANAKKIIVGRTSLGAPNVSGADDNGKYFICADGADVYLYSSNDIAMYDSVARFVEMIKASTGSVVTVDPDIGAVSFEDDYLTSMSFNLLVSNITTERKARVVSMIEKYMPDTFGVQEASETWISTLEKELGDVYDNVGTGRDKNGTGERSSVFYKKDKFTLRDSGTKWMSSTPDVVSRVEGSLCNRVFSYALLECKSDGKQFMHINVHTDHTNDENVRLEQVKVLMAFVQLHSDKAILISGDFNSKKGNSSIEHVMKFVEDSAELAIATDTSPTFRDSIIDFIFVTEGDFTVYEYGVDMSKINGDYPSDHYPIFIKYNLK